MLSCKKSQEKLPYTGKGLLGVSYDTVHLEHSPDLTGLYSIRRGEPYCAGEAKVWVTAAQTDQ